jgi:hypothetical protein
MGKYSKASLEHRSIGFARIQPAWSDPRAAADQTLVHVQVGREP